MVSHVLLADGWHRVSGESFTLDAYDYIHHGNPDEPDEFDWVHRAGDSHICPADFSFVEEHPEVDGTPRERVGGPLTNIVAVPYHDR
jgi:hypothetical protein